MYGSMTVGILKEMLEGLDDDTEIRVAHQPSWPFEYSIQDEFVNSQDVTEHYEILKSDDGWYIEHPDEGTMAGPFETSELAEADLAKQRESEGEELGKVIWLSEGSQIGYLPGPVSKALGWR